MNHYFPQVEIDDNKYINNIICNLWNKNDEINEMLYDYKTNKLYILFSKMDLPWNGFLRKLKANETEEEKQMREEKEKR